MERTTKTEQWSCKQDHSDFEVYYRNRSSAPKRHGPCSLADVRPTAPRLTQMVLSQQCIPSSGPMNNMDLKVRIRHDQALYAPLPESRGYDEHGRPDDVPGCKTQPSPWTGSPHALYLGQGLLSHQPHVTIRCDVDTSKTGVVTRAIGLVVAFQKSPLKSQCMKAGRTRGSRVPVRDHHGSRHRAPRGTFHDVS